MPEDSRSCERQGEILPPETSEEAQISQYLQFRLLASGTLKQCIFTDFTYQACDDTTIVQQFSWEDVSKPLLNPARVPMTNQSNNITEVQLGEPISLLGLLTRVSERS